MQEPNPTLVVDLFPGERRALLDLLRSLSHRQWARPTACPGWSVHDVALHVLGDDIGVISRKRDRYHDPAAAAGTDLSQWDQLVAFINRQNQAWVQATRRISPHLLCDLLEVTGEAVRAHFSRLDQLALGDPVGWAGPEPAPVWLDTAREYSERWLHQQHIRDAVGQPGLKDRHWFGPVLETFVRALPHTLRRVGAPAGSAVLLTITGDAGGEWLAVRTVEKWVLGSERVCRRPQQ